MNFIKILGGIGAGILAGAGLIVAGRTGLGKSDAEPAENKDQEAPEEDTATETVEAEEVQEAPAEEAAE